MFGIDPTNVHTLDLHVAAHDAIVLTVHRYADYEELPGILRAIETTRFTLVPISTEVSDAAPR